MTDQDQDGVIRREIVIGASISAVASAVLFLLLFGFSNIRVAGLGGFAFDFVPQSFMIGLLGSLAPALAAAKRARAALPEAIHGRPPLLPLLRHAVLMAILCGVLIGGGLAIMLPFILPPVIGPAAGLAGKVIFGVALAAAVTPRAVRAGHRTGVNAKDGLAGEAGRGDPLRQRDLPVEVDPK